MNGRTEKDVVLADDLVVIEVAVNDKYGQDQEEEIQLKPTSKDKDNKMLEKQVPLNGE